jgi:hypothetical protein
MKWNSKIVMIIVFFTMISSWYSVYATPLTDVKTIVGQLQTTDTTLPSVTDQKWSIGRLLSLIFDVATGKIKVDFLDIIDTATGKIKTGLLPSVVGSAVELWQKSGNNIYYSTGSVGIGTSTFNTNSPANSLQAQGEIISNASNPFRSVFWSYGAVWRNDWNDFMLGITYPWSDFKYNIPAFFPLKFNFIDERFTLSSNETKLTQEWADIMFRWGRAPSWNTWEKANGYWNHFTLDNYKWKARINPYYTDTFWNMQLADRALLEVYWAKGWVNIGHDGGSPAIEMRSNNGFGPYIDLSNDADSDFDARITLGGDDTLRIEWAKFDASAWPSWSYCIIQAQGGSCPTGFTAQNPAPDYNSHSAIAWNDSSWPDTRSMKRPDDSSNNMTLEKARAFCCK